MRLLILITQFVAVFFVAPFIILLLASLIFPRRAMDSIARMGFVWCPGVITLFCALSQGKLIFGYFVAGIFIGGMQAAFVYYIWFSVLTRLRYGSQTVAQKAEEPSEDQIV